MLPSEVRTDNLFAGAGDVEAILCAPAQPPVANGPLPIPIEVRWFALACAAKAAPYVCLLEGGITTGLRMKSDDGNLVGVSLGLVLREHFRERRRSHSVVPTRRDGIVVSGSWRGRILKQQLNDLTRYGLWNVSVDRDAPARQGQMQYVLFVRHSSTIHLEDSAYQGVGALGELEIRLASGGLATVRGTPAEIAEVLRLAGLGAAPSEHAGSGGAQKHAKQTPSPKKAVARGRALGPTARVIELVDEGFFKSRRRLSDVLDELKRGGHLYKVTDLSPIVVRLVRDKRLRRAKGDAGVWEYANY